MMSKWLLTLAFAVCGWTQPTLAAPSLAGDYRGVLQLDQTDSDLLARMQLVATRTDGNQLLLTGFLTFYLGDYNSDEYVSFLFDAIRYNLITGELIFDQTDQDVSMRAITVGDGSLQLDVHSQWAGIAGTLTLAKEAAATSTRQLLSPVSGSYEGQCDGEAAFLELQTMRGGSLQDPADPFGVYKISGRGGKRIRALCPNAQNLPCVTNLIESGTYDIYSGHLSVIGRQATLSCQVAGAELDCGICQYRRTDDRIPSRPRLSPPMASPVWEMPGSALNPTGAIEGSYRGYMHHERLDGYQPLSFDIITYRDQDGEEDEELQMSAVARLTFGEAPSRESLVYRFERQPFQLLADQYLFKHPEGGHDARPLVTVMDGERLEGIWYSTTFGRVGTFKLAKTDAVTIPTSAQVIQPLSAGYGSTDMTLDIQVGRTVDGSSEADPFAPLRMTGYFWYRSGITRRIPVTAAAYDFYTGKIGFETDDGRRSSTGTRQIDGSMQLTWQGLVYGTLMQSGRTERFQVGD